MAAKSPGNDDDQTHYDKVEYAYDMLGRLATVAVKERSDYDFNEPTEYWYNAVGSLEQIDYPNGNSSVYTYDNLNRLRAGLERQRL